MPFPLTRALCVRVCALIFCLSTLGPHSYSPPPPPPYRFRAAFCSGIHPTKDSTQLRTAPASFRNRCSHFTQRFPPRCHPCCSRRRRRRLPTRTSRRRCRRRSRCRVIQRVTLKCREQVPKEHSHNRSSHQPLHSPHYTVILQLTHIHLLPNRCRRILASSTTAIHRALQKP